MKKVITIAVLFGALLILTQEGISAAGFSKNGTLPKVSAVSAAPTGGGSCCATGGSTAATASGCGMMSGQSGSTSGGCQMGGSASGGATSTSLKDAEQAGVTYYKAKGGQGDVTAKATDFGCHVQVDILKNGAVVASYGYANGQITG